MIKSFILMLTFITRIPLPLRFEFEEKDFIRGMHMMPYIGLGLGIPLGALSYGLRGVDPLIRGFIILLAYVIMVGGLHIDGLSDYCDGIFSGRPKDRIFEIMSDSHTGTFGVVGVGLYLIGMVIGLGEAPWQVVLLMPFIGRSMGVIAMAFGKYPKDAGLGMALINHGKPRDGFIVELFMFGMGYWLLPFGWLSLVGVLATVFLILVMIVRTSQILGGITGDVIGAVIEMSQVLWLFTMILIGGMV